MDKLKIKDKKIEARFIEILNEYSKNIDSDKLNLIKVIILRFKKNSKNENFLPLIVLYWLLFFNVIDINNKHFTQEEKITIKKIHELFLYDINWDFEKYIKWMTDASDDLFLFKIIIKYTVLNDEKKYLINIPNHNNYFKSIWYLIPLLTLKDSVFLLFFQDIYFKKVYPEEFVKIKNKHLSETSTKLELPGYYIINTVNSLNITMEKAWVDWIINLRKKSYFSLYSKYNRKKESSITDVIWVRIIFSSLTKLNKFKNEFESDFLLIKKKDYILNPKENWYKAIHYTFINPFRNWEVLVELQIKTKKMEEEIHQNKNSLSHFCYTVKLNKWDNLFKEVHVWHKILENFLK